MNNDQSESQFSVLWPLAKRSIKTQGAAAGLPDLSGKTVCELWDYIFRGDVMYALIRARLTVLYPGIKFVSYKEFGNIHGPKQRDIIAGLAAKLRAFKCDAVISGIGA
jgi:hypothetical protein